MSENVPRNRKRTGRKVLCTKIAPETQEYGCFKALGQKQLHSERKKSSSLRNLPKVSTTKFKQNLEFWKKGTKGVHLLSRGGCLLKLKENEEMFLHLGTTSLFFCWSENKPCVILHKAHHSAHSPAWLETMNIYISEAQNEKKSQDHTQILFFFFPKN